MTPLTIVSSAISPATAVAALENALLADLDPELDGARLFSPIDRGEFLLMPSGNSEYAGIKALTIPSGKPAAGYPKIQGTYILFSATTLEPLAVMDGAELTLARTSAMTAMAVKHMLLADPRNSESDWATRALSVLVFGAGPQALHHVRSLGTVCTLGTVTVTSRRPEPVDTLVELLRTEGVDAAHGSVEDIPTADIIVCVTSATDPLFPGEMVSPHTVVAAVGSHGLGVREIDPELARRADIVVEGRASAMRESGNLIPARSVAEWDDYPLTNVAELVRGNFQRRTDAPALYTAVGMSWQDLIVAQAAYVVGRTDVTPV